MATRSTQPADEEVDEVTRPSDLGFGTREIEVEPVKAPPPSAAPDGTVVVRMAETIEEFTYGNPYQHFRLEAGKIYRLPVDMANYLHSLGKLYAG